MKRFWLFIVLFLSACGIVRYDFDIEQEVHIPGAKSIIDYYQLPIGYYKDLEETYLVQPGGGLYLFEYAYNNEDINSELHLEYSYLLEVLSTASSAKNLYEENIDLIDGTFLGDSLQERLLNGLDIPADEYYGKEFFLDSSSVGSYLVLRIDEAVLSFRPNMTEKELPRFYDNFIRPYLIKTIEIKELDAPK